MSPRYFISVRKDPGFHRAHEGEIKVRKILKICHKAAEEGLVGTRHVAELSHMLPERRQGAHRVGQQDCKERRRRYRKGG